MFFFYKLTIMYKNHKSKMQFFKKYQFLLYNNLKVYTLLLIPSLISILWHFNNNQLPVTDAIDYLWPAFHIYTDISRLNLFEATHGIYLERGWRPTIFHLFYLPFMVLSNGNLLFAVGAVHSLFSLITTIFLFLVFREVFNKTTAALCACFIGISSSVIFGGSTIPGFTEVAFISAFTGIIFFLSRGKTIFKQKEFYLFSILIFFLFAIRPVEALIYLILPLAIYFSTLYKNQKISLYTTFYILWFITLCVIILFCFSFFTGIKIHLGMLGLVDAYELFLEIFKFFIYTSIFLFISLQFIPKKVIADSFYFEKSLILASSLITVWWLPSFQTL